MATSNMEMTNIDIQEVEVELELEIKNKMENENKNKDDHEHKLEKEFTDSTHGYLLYFVHDGFGFDGCLIGLFIALIQFICYCMFAVEAADLWERDEVPVMVSWGDCNQFGKERVYLLGGWNNTYDANTTEDSEIEWIEDEHNLVCQADEPDSQWYIMQCCLPMIILSAFLLEDIIMCCKIWVCNKYNRHDLWSKIMAVILFGQCVLALIAGAIFGFQGVWGGSTYDGLMNSIGILFVHEVDNQVFSALQASQFLQNSGKHQCLCVSILKKYRRGIVYSICTLIAIIIGALIIPSIMVESNNYDQYDYKWNWNYTTTTNASFTTTAFNDSYYSNTVSSTAASSTGGSASSTGAASTASTN